MEQQKKLDDLQILNMLNGENLVVRSWKDVFQGELQVKREDQKVFFVVKNKDGEQTVRLKDVKYIMGNLHFLPHAYIKTHGGVSGFILSKINKRRTLTFLLYSGEMIVGKIISEYPYSFLVEASPGRHYLLMKHSIKFITSYGAGASELLKARKTSVTEWIPRKEWVNKKKTKTLLKARRSGKKVILSLREGETLKGIIKDVSPHAILFSTVYKDVPMKLVIYRHTITGVKNVKKKKKKRK